MMCWSWIIAWGRYQYTPFSSPLALHPSSQISPIEILSRHPIGVNLYLGSGYPLISTPTWSLLQDVDRWKGGKRVLAFLRRRLQHTLLFNVYLQLQSIQRSISFLERSYLLYMWYENLDSTFVSRRRWLVGWFRRKDAILRVRRGGCRIEAGLPVS
jgi:hypothetical protein